MVKTLASVCTSMGTENYWKRIQEIVMVVIVVDSEEEVWETRG